ncbi:hypothetical protein [Flaviaesturariibacter amylovorans]|uniref:YtxH domain-containing protein n=1 Tax=Flaviaesturariibacter amylovorans TaxID=1084520 RepID=A0ABP8H2I9_9BACT
MKKVFLALAFAASLTACNSSSDTAADQKTDSLENKADSTKGAIDSAAEAKKSAIDSTTEQKVNAIDSAAGKTDSANAARQ